MRILITDVTDMSQGNQCVAGWDIDNHRMIRPLPNGSNWTTNSAEKYRIIPGIIIRIQPTGREHNGSYPHSTEDTVINAEEIEVLDQTPVNWFTEYNLAVSDTVNAIFDGAIENSSQFNGNLQGVHIRTGTKCRSLGAIIIDRNRLQLVSDSYQDGPKKLKAIINDGEGSYSLSVSSHALKEAFANEGLPGANAALPNNERFHVRLGLARAFPDMPERCTLMLNGVHG